VQFEWTWQHPRESLAVREAASGIKSLSGAGNKVKLACTMLNLPSWEK
jgi:structure-specific endonuclease subunit SLX1